MLLFTASVSAQTTEICNNNIDDDGDGLIDCLDGDCADAIDCLPCFQQNFTFPEINTAWDELELEKLRVGSLDSTWYFSTSRTGSRGFAYVGTCSCDPNNGWACNSLPNADWISNGNNCDRLGNVWYHTLFELDSALAPYFQLEVEIHADDLIEDVYLNNRRLNLNIPQRGSWSSGTSIKFNIQGGFQGGENELSFNINNTGGPGGLALIARPVDDLDRDGVPNEQDLCPLSPPGISVDEFGCGFKFTQADTSICQNSIFQWGDQLIFAAGVYTDTLSALSGCDSIVELTVDIVPFNPIVNTVPLLCNGDGNGQILIDLGSNEAASYALVNQNTNFSRTDNFNGLTTISNLSGGFYDLRVENEKGCQFIRTVNLVEPSPLEVIEKPQNVLCFGENNGSIQLATQGGTNPYTYSLSRPSDGETFPSSDFHPNLSAGIYEYTVLDANNCLIRDTVIINQPADPLSAQLSDKTDVDCFGNLTGELSISGLGGTMPYTYHLDLQGISNNDGIFTGLGASDYEVRITDINGCESMIRDTIRSPEGLFASIDSLQDVLCFGEQTGKAVIKGVGGTPPYRVSLDSINFSNNLILDSLAQGSKRVYLLDANNCEVSFEFLVPEPPLLEASITEIQNIACNGQTTGAISLNIEGGVPSYDIRLDDLNIFGYSSSFIRFFALSAGQKSIEVIDQNGCNVQLDTLLSQPDSLEIIIRDLIPVACFGESNGKLRIIGQGGTAPYDLFVNGQTSPKMLEDLSAGFYQLRLVDDSSCVSELRVEIPQPDLLELALVSKTDATCDLPNGNINLQPFGGTPPYEFNWSAPAESQGQQAAELAPETYLIMAEDANGCMTDLQVDIAAIPPPSADFTFSPSPPTPILETDPLVIFQNQSSGTIAGYYWNFGSIQESIEENPSNLFPGPGTYNVSLIAFDPDNACPDTVIQEIVIIPEGSIWLPNVFSPNGDGSYDQFQVKGEGIQQFRMKIFDRWGRVVYTQVQLEMGWNGRRSSGQEAPIGVYYYELEAVYFTGERVLQNGSFTLLR